MNVLESVRKLEEDISVLEGKVGNLYKLQSKLNEIKRKRDEHFAYTNNFGEHVTFTLKVEGCDVSLDINDEMLLKIVNKNIQSSSEVVLLNKLKTKLKTIKEVLKESDYD